MSPRRVVRWQKPMHGKEAAITVARIFSTPVRTSYWEESADSLDFESLARGCCLVAGWYIYSPSRQNSGELPETTQVPPRRRSDAIRNTSALDFASHGRRTGRAVGRSRRHRV